MNRTLLSLAVLAIGLVAAPRQADALHWPTWVVPEGDPVWSLTARVGPYRPRLSADPTSQAGQYLAAQFSTGLSDSPFGHGPVMKALEVDYYFLRDVGRLGVSVGIGHWNVDGYSQVCTVAGTTTPRDCTTQDVISGLSQDGNTRQSLTVLPISVSAIYRADQLMEMFNVPLMPYAKVGLGYHFWWARSGGGGAGDGGTLGYHGTLGLALNLNWMDPTEPSRSSILGIFSAHFFVELTYIGADGFGASPNQRLDLSDFTGSLGLAVDFDSLPGS